MPADAEVSSGPTSNRSTHAQLSSMPTVAWRLVDKISLQRCPKLWPLVPPPHISRWKHPILADNHFSFIPVIGCTITYDGNLSTLVSKLIENIMVAGCHEGSYIWWDDDIGQSGSGPIKEQWNRHQAGLSKRHVAPLAEGMLHMQDRLKKQLSASMPCKLLRKTIAAKRIVLVPCRVNFLQSGLKALGVSAWSPFMQ